MSNDEQPGEGSVPPVDQSKLDEAITTDTGSDEEKVDGPYFTAPDQTFWKCLVGAKGRGEVTEAASIPGGVLVRTWVYDDGFNSVSMVFLKGVNLYVDADTNLGQLVT